MIKECKNTYCPFCNGCKAEATCNNFMAEEPKGTVTTSTIDVTPLPEWIYKETTTTSIYQVEQNKTVKLPTAEEYRQANPPKYEQMSMFSEPKYICPKCGGNMCRNQMVVLTSYPAQYEYVCDMCGNVEYQYK